MRIIDIYDMYDSRRFMLDMDIQDINTNDYRHIWHHLRFILGMDFIKLRKIHILILVNLCWTWIYIKYQLIQQTIWIMDIHDSRRFMLEMDTQDIKTHEYRHVWHYYRFLLGIDIIT